MVLEDKFLNTSNAIVQLPISKSVSNREMIIAAMAGVEIDCDKISKADDSILLYELLQRKDGLLHCGLGGTTFRFLMAFFSVQQGVSVQLTGNEELLKRPNDILVQSIHDLGGNVKEVNNGKDHYFNIIGRNIEGGRITIDSSISSQFTSALMMVGVSMINGLEIELKGEVVSFSYLNLTAKLMQHHGADVSISPNLIKVNHCAYYFDDLYVEYDWTSAAYWYQVAAFVPGLSIHLNGLRTESVQGDVVAIQIFEKFGILSRSTENGVLIFSNPEHKIEELTLNCSDFPDLVPSIVVLACAFGLKFNLIGIHHLKHKESDRIESLKLELLKLGVTLNYEGGLLNGEGKIEISDEVVTINTHQDHRIAMAFALLTLLGVKIKIDDPEVVNKSYPNFWDELKKIKFLS